MAWNITNLGDASNNLDAGWCSVDLKDVENGDGKDSDCQRAKGTNIDQLPAQIMS